MFWSPKIQPNGTGVARPVVGFMGFGVPPLVLPRFQLGAVPVPLRV